MADAKIAPPAQPRPRRRRGRDGLSQGVLTATAPQAARAPIEDPRLVPARKAVFSLGDFTVNTVLTSLAILYVTHYLLVVAGLRPELAGAVQLIGRAIDAFADPAMGRISDRCRWRWGRRRPFFLLGAIPFGAGFALLWLHLPRRLAARDVRLLHGDLRGDVALDDGGRGALPRAATRDGARLRRAHVAERVAQRGLDPGRVRGDRDPAGRQCVRRRARGLHGRGRALRRGRRGALARDLRRHLGAARLPGARGDAAVLRGRPARRAPRQLPPARRPVPVRARRDGPRRRDADPLLHALARAQRRLRAHDGPVLRRGAGFAALLGAARRTHGEGDRVRDRRALVGGRARGDRVRRSPTGRAGS